MFSSTWDIQKLIKSITPNVLIEHCSVCYTLVKIYQSETNLKSEKINVPSRSVCQSINSKDAVDWLIDWSLKMGEMWQVNFHLKSHCQVKILK